MDNLIVYSVPKNLEVLEVYYLLMIDQPLLKIDFYKLLIFNQDYVEKQPNIISNALPQQSYSSI
jgi:hypothetical protein